jgi:hypothetical protein
LILIKAVDTAHLNSDAGQLEYLLQYHHLTDNPKALKRRLPPRNMAFGGIYDQLVADSPVILQMKTAGSPF